MDAGKSLVKVLTDLVSGNDSSFGLPMAISSFYLHMVDSKGSKLFCLPTRAPIPFTRAQPSLLNYFIKDPTS
jgi:hypothetical protein